MNEDGVTMLSHHPPAHEDEVRGSASPSTLRFTAFDTPLIATSPSFSFPIILLMKSFRNLNFALTIFLTYVKLQNRA